MATRRKYRQPQGYRDGGAVPSGAVIPDSVRALPVEPAPIAKSIPNGELAEWNNSPVSSISADLPIPRKPDDGADALVRAHAATMRAEELQRKPPTVEQHIDQIPGLTSHKRAFLKAHPKMATDPEEARAMSFHYQAALSAGVPDDSEEMNRAILAGMYREREFKDKAPPADAPPAPRAPIAAPRNSLPMAAPPSRSVPSYSSGKPASSTKMTLSAEERDIAHKSIINRPDMPPLSDAQKEYVYLQNRNRYRSMLADGSYSEQGNGGSPPLRAGYRDE